MISVQQFLEHFYRDISFTYDEFVDKFSAK